MNETPVSLKTWVEQYIAWGLISDLCREQGLNAHIAAWEDDIVRREKMETALRARGLVCEWQENGDLTLVLLGETGLREAQHEHD